jgi:hypothetical protein
MRASVLLVWLALLYGVAPAQGWVRHTDVPVGAVNYGISTGSALCNGDTLVYCLKGRYNEFYSYSPAANVWTRRESLPLIGASGKIRRAGRGTSLAGSPQGIFCSKGNYSAEFWHYVPDSLNYPWTQRPDVPIGARLPGDGSGMAVVDSFLYFVRGNLTFEFFRFHLNRGLWDVSLRAYPAGPSGKPVGSGGCVTAAQGRVYSLKGNSTPEFYSFDPESLVWRDEPNIPLGPRNKAVAYGGCITWDGRDTIYCLKGNFTNEFWGYSLSAGNWTQLPDMPPLVEYVGRGASLAAVGDAIYALRGNSTREFWAYTPTTGIAGPPTPTMRKLSLTITPSPARGPVSFDLSPGNRPVRLRVAAPDGRTVRDLGTFTSPALVNWDGTDRLGRPAPAGVYFCAAECPTGRVVARFVKLGD